MRLFVLDDAKSERIQNELLRGASFSELEIKPIGPTPRFLPPNGSERAYRKSLFQIIKNIQENVEQIIFPFIEGLVKERDRSIRSDAWPDEAERLIETLGLNIGQTARVNPAILAENIGQKTSDWNNKEWRKIMKGVLGVNVNLREPWLNNQLQSFTKNNVALIKSIKDKSVTDIEGILQRGVAAGDRSSTIQKQIQKQFGATRRRARLIARDQVAKLNSDITKARQESLGIDTYTWRTSKDERVRGNPGGLYPSAKPSHFVMDGKVCKWSDPSVYSEDGGETWIPRVGKMPLVHPGQAVQCRCIAEPRFTEPKK